MRESGPHLFTHLLVIEDWGKRGADLQLAIDRALLETTSLPVLRFYRWSSPCVTIGYFDSIKEAAERYPQIPIVRRWTGGGSVLHGTDAPYSLIVPRSEPFASVRPCDSYRQIHEALAETLRDTVPNVVTANECTPKKSSACFDNPVRDDLVAGTCKIAGAGQRRTRLGFLHQGSIQIGTPHFSGALKFAALLANTFEVAPLPELVEERARRTQ